MIHNQNPTEYLTRDIYLATILSQSKVPLIRVESNGARAIFIFKASEKIEGLIAKYFNGELRLDPRSIFEDWKALKSMAFSSTNNVRC